MKKKLLFAAAMLLAAVGVNAQTDVTSTYLTNADFSQGTPVDNHVCGYGKDMAKNGTTYYGFQAVDGWSYEVLAGVTDEGGFTNSGMGGAVFAYGSEWQLKGNNKSAPATNPAGEASGNCLGFFGVWGNGGYYYQEVELPAGGYELTIPVYNASGTQGNTSYIGFIPNEGTSHTAACNPTVETWTTLTVKFTLTEKTAGRIALGYKSNGSGSGANPHLFFESVTITWTDPLVSLKAEYQEALTAATAANEDPAYSNVDGSERIALYNSINDIPEETEASYSEVIKALTDATDAFKAAKTAYDLAASTPELPYADLDKAPVIDETTVAADLLVALRAYYESNAAAEGVEGAVDMRSYILNNDATDGNNGWTWTGNKNNPRNTESWTDSEGNHAYMYFDGGNWSGTGWTTTMEQAITLPAGRYLLTAKGRASDGVTLTMSVGEESVALPNVNASGNVFNFGWNDGFVVFETDGNAVTIKINATTEDNHQWFSVGDFRLMQLEAHIDRAALLAAINNATTAKNRLNVGTSVFQIPTSAATTLEEAIATAQAVYENESATVAEVEAAIKAINDAVSAFEAAPLNAPEPGNKYGITIVTEGHPYKGKALVAGNGATSANNPTGNFFNVKGDSPYLAQTFTFTSAENAEDPNLYYISVELPEGTVYLTNGANNGSAAGWAPSQIQGTTDSSKRLAFRIAASTTVEGAFNIINTANNYNVVAQNGGNIYTDENAQQNGEFALVEPTLVEVPVAVAAGKFATRIYPFKPAVANDGVVYYSCEAAEENELTLSEVEEPAANVPYILEAKLDVDETQQGYSIAGAATYTDGWLTGVFAQTTITEGYVLQTKEGKQAFYIINPEKPINVPAYRAYLTVSGSDVKSFNLGDDTTGISALEALTNNAFEAIYSADGVKLNRIEKGVNILKMSDGTTRKVILK